MPLIDFEAVVNAEIGIAPSEIGRVQALTISVSAEIEAEAVSNACATGDIGHTLDYGLLRHIIHQVFESKRFNLLEEPALLIKQKISAVPCVKQVRVSLAKTRPWADVPRVSLTV